MSIKPVACADNGILNWYAGSCIREKVDLYAIPDTHRVVSVELLQQVLFRSCFLPEHLEDAVQEIIEDKP